jgi:hypothetical protein
MVLSASEAYFFCSDKYYGIGILEDLLSDFLWQSGVHEPQGSSS